MKLTLCIRQIGKVANHATKNGKLNSHSTVCFKDIVALVDRYSSYNPTALSLQSIVEFGSKNACIRKSYYFLRQELPVRLANIMQEFNHLPEQLNMMPSVTQVRGWYMQSFVDLLEFDQSSGEDDRTIDRFGQQLDVIRNRHSKVVETMAQGVIELKEDRQYDQQLENTIQYFLDRFYMNRISIRMLINQHLLLFGKMESPPSHVGSIDPDCDVLAIAEDAYENARFLCDQYYMTAPDCNFKCLNAYAENSEERIKLTYVPSHLYHMLFELFKNALRAVVEYYPDGSDLPPIQMLLVRGKEDLSIKLSDQGGGITRSEIDLLFNYMYSTAPRPPSPSAANVTPLAGYGYGLPLSRLYAKYFNGDMWLSSVEGYGTDALMYLKVFPAEANELLPIYNKTSSLRYQSSIPVGDWSDPTQTTGLHGAVHQVTPSAQNRSYSTKARCLGYKVKGAATVGDPGNQGYIVGRKHRNAPQGLYDTAAPATAAAPVAAPIAAPVAPVAAPAAAVAAAALGASSFGASLS